MAQNFADRIAYAVADTIQGGVENGVSTLDALIHRVYCAVNPPSEHPQQDKVQPVECDDGTTEFVIVVVEAPGTLPTSQTVNV